MELRWREWFPKTGADKAVKEQRGVGCEVVWKDLDLGEFQSCELTCLIQRGFSLSLQESGWVVLVVFKV